MDGQEKNKKGFWARFVEALDKKMETQAQRPCCKKEKKEDKPCCSR